MKKFFLNLAIIFPLLAIYSCVTNNSSETRNIPNFIGKKGSLILSNCQLNKFNWNQGKVFQSSYSNIFQVRVSENKDSLYLHYFVDSGNDYAKIIEVVSGKEEFVVDSVLIRARKNDTILTNFISRQYDNLMIDNGNLYFYTEEYDPMEYCRHQRYYRQYYKYKIGSQSKPISIQNIPFQLRTVFNSYEKITYTKDSLKAAKTNGYELIISNVGDPTKDLEKLLTKDNFEPLRWEPCKDLSINRLLSIDNKDIIDPFYGQMAWSKDSKNLFFTITHGDRQGLWMYNVSLQKLMQINDKRTKNPFVFTYQNVRYITYNNGNQIYCTYYDIKNQPKFSATPSQKQIYEEINFDEFWSRGIIYESTEKEEKLLKPKSVVYNDTLRYYFYGMHNHCFDDNSDSISLNLYEFIPDCKNSPTIIDSFRCSIDNQQRFQNMMKDALIIKNDGIYYLKEPNVSYQNYQVYISDTIEFVNYSFTTNTKKENTIYKELKKDIRNFGLYSFSKNNLCAWSNNSGSLCLFETSPEYTIEQNYNILDSIIIKDDDVYYRNRMGPCYTEEQYLVDKRRAVFEKLGKYKIKLAFNVESFDLNETYCYNIGTMSWSNNGSCLFFNSSKCGIWSVNISSHDIEKIIPEGDAMDPFYFEYKQTPYVLYVVNNKLMICEPSL